MKDETNYKPMYSRDVSEPRPSPSRLKLEERKRLFAGINAFVRKHGDGWLTSVAGEREVRLEVLPNSSLPDELRKLGYKLELDGEGERISHSAIVEEFVTGLDGALEPLIEGSNLPVASTVTHAGICKVTRYAFDMP
jgi:hypothetical protein